jgi:hypothetical protein
MLFVVPPLLCAKAIALIRRVDADYAFTVARSFKIRQWLLQLLMKKK